MSTTALYIRLRGLLTPRGLWTRALKALSTASRWSPTSGPPKHPFDRRHRVDTDGLIYAEGLRTGHEHDGQSAGYYATAPSLFRGALTRWTETLADSGFSLRDYTLVDIGCGKGRAVMLASEYAFREVVGIELNPRLAAVARRNLRKWLRWPRACRTIRIVHGDALSMPIPDGPVVLFFFNSFEREMVQMWLDRLARVGSTREHPIDLIYVHPEFDALVRQVPGMQVLAREEIPFSAEDTASDVFGVAVDRCAIYRLQRRSALPRLTIETQDTQISGREH